MPTSEDITRPGRYLYFDPLGNEPEEVEVIATDRGLAVRMDDEVVLLADMPGEFEPVG